LPAWLIQTLPTRQGNTSPKHFGISVNAGSSSLQVQQNMGGSLVLSRLQCSLDSVLLCVCCGKLAQVDDCLDVSVLCMAVV